MIVVLVLLFVDVLILLHWYWNYEPSLCVWFTHVWTTIVPCLYDGKFNQITLYRGEACDSL